MNTSKGIVTFIRKANPVKDSVATGQITKSHEIYFHHFKTGHQELVFESTEAAKAFAIKNECAFLKKRN